MVATTFAADTPLVVTAWSIRKASRELACGGVFCRREMMTCFCFARLWSVRACSPMCSSLKCAIRENRGVSAWISRDLSGTVMTA